MRSLLLLLLVSTFLPTQPALAQVPENVAKATILSGWRGEDGLHRAALSIELAPGWKTYWRAAGEGGIPPIFDWSESQNLAGAEIHFPVPRVFEQNGMRSFGYETSVVFPFIARPSNASGTIALKGRVDLGVCLDVCVPITLDVSATLPPIGQRGAAEIRAAFADRPLTVSEAGLEKMSCTIEPITDGLRVTSSFDLRGNEKPIAVVMEVADKSVWVSHAEMVEENGLLRATADMVPPNAQPFFLARDSIRVTLLNGETAIEFDGCG